MAPEKISSPVVLRQLAGAARCRIAVEGFTALVDGQVAQPQATAVPTAPGAGARLAAAVPPVTAGLGQAGASGAKLLATKVRLAGALRKLEVELEAAVTAAARQGRTGDDPVQAAARKITALLSRFDTESGTDAVVTLRKGLAALPQPADAAAKSPEAAQTPQVAIAALFANVATLLGLTRPVPNLQTAPSQRLLLAPVADGSAAQAPASAEAPPVLIPAQTVAQTVAPNMTSTPGAPAMPAVTAMPARAGAVVATPGRAEEVAGDHRGIVPRIAAALETALRAFHARKPAGAPAVTPASAPTPTLASTLVAALPGAGLGTTTGGTEARQPAADLPRLQAPLDHRGAVAPAKLVPAARFAGVVSAQIRSAEISAKHTRIALAPQGLGSIEIDLRHDDSGALRVVVRADNPVVLEAMRGDRDTLAGILAGNSLAAAGSTLDFQDFGGRDRHEDSVETPVAALGVEPDESAPDWQQTISNGKLDIRT